MFAFTGCTVYNAVILKRDPAHAVPAAVAPLIVKALKRDTVNDVTPAPNSDVHGVTRHLEKLGAVRFASRTGTKCVEPRSRGRAAGCADSGHLREELALFKPTRRCAELHISAAATADPLTGADAVTRNCGEQPLPGAAAVAACHALERAHGKRDPACEHAPPRPDCGTGTGELAERRLGGSVRAACPAGRMYGQVCPRCVTR